MSASKGLPSWAQRDAVRYIFDAARRLGGEARIVGGAVRDWLAGFDVREIDMAVNTIGLNMLEVEGFSEILNRMGPIDGTIVVDACDVNTERFAKRIMSRLKHWSKDANMVSEHKADDRHISVAAASIVAKYTRDKHIKDLEESLGFEIGSGYPSDPKTIGILPKLMQEDEPNEHLR